MKIGRKFEKRREKKTEFDSIFKDLIQELSGLVGAEERGPDLWQLLVCDHGEPGLQGVADLDLVPLSVKLDTASTVKNVKR